MVRSFTLVHDRLVAATAAFLARDRAVAREVAARDKELDELHDRIQQRAVALLTTRPGPAEAEVRALITIVRIAPEIERSGDLVTHIADHGAQRLASWLTPRAQDLIAQMDEITADMWDQAARAYADCDLGAADCLRVIDDEVDDLHVSLTTELAAMSMSVPVAIQIGLVARYFERLGDHAVNVARQLRQLESVGV